MLVLQWIQFLLGAAFLLTGLAVFLLELFGIFRFDYVLNRMHAAAMGDTLGLFCSLFGLVILSGFTFTSLKLLMIILFFWFASPVSSHLLTKLEATTNDSLEKHCKNYPTVAALEAEVEQEEAIDTKEEMCHD